MKKLLLLAFSLVAFASFASDGPAFPFDMNEIVNAPGYDATVVHPIRDKNRVRTRDCFGPTWHVYNGAPYYGPYSNGHVWYPHGRVYGHPPSAGLGVGIAAGIVTGVAVATCCC